MAEMETDQPPEQECSLPHECSTGRISRFSDTLKTGGEERSNKMSIAFCDYKFEIWGEVIFLKDQVSASVKIMSPDHMWPISLKWKLGISEISGSTTKWIQAPDEVVNSAGEIIGSTKPLTKDVTYHTFKYYKDRNADVTMKWHVTITKASFASLEKALERAQRNVLSNHYYCGKVLKNLRTSKLVEDDEELDKYIKRSGID